MKTRFQKAVGRLRLLFGFCPECNSDGPQRDSCRVCGGYRGYFPPSETIKDQWRRRFTMARCTHGYPMEDSCPECNAWLRNRPIPQDPRRG